MTQAGSGPEVFHPTIDVDATFADIAEHSLADLQGIGQSHGNEIGDLYEADMGTRVTAYALGTRVTAAALGTRVTASAQGTRVTAA